jgi:hypothetical protein
LPGVLVGGLSALSHDVDTVQQEGFGGRCDPDVWLAAQQSGRFFITQHLDFCDLRWFEPGTRAGLLLVRLAKPGRLALAERVVQVFGSGDADTRAGCYLVATDIKLRVHRPGDQ